jgi:hypothetical protein
MPDGEGRPAEVLNELFPALTAVVAAATALA